jgi:hypothetical protein
LREGETELGYNCGQRLMNRSAEAIRSSASKRARPNKKKVYPALFISYTHESPAHKQWVLKLATDLRANGVDAILDQWELKFGSDLTLFMERNIRGANRVLLVCTPTYQKKATVGKGGVGYERVVVTGEMAENLDTTKFICVLRSGDPESSIPVFARTRMYIDFRNDSEYQDHLLELLRDIHLAPQNPKPPIGANPFSDNDSASKKNEQSLLVKSAPTPSAPNEKPPIGENPFTPEVIEAMRRPVRHRMPDTRMSLTHKFEIAGHEGFITVGLFEDGQPGEILIQMSKEGSTIGGLVNSVAMLTSIALQYGVPLEVLIKKFAFQRFEPSGFTKNPDVRNATSIMDYVFRWLGCQFIKGYREAIAPPRPRSANSGISERSLSK